MPHVNSLNLVLGDVFSPIPGNGHDSGMCYDGKGQALWITLVGGQFQVWRTRDGWKSLISEDGSVDYLSTVAAGPFYDVVVDDATSAALWRVGGNLFASVSGMNTAALLAGHWLYRDTSPDADGSGPWVLHSTVQSVALDGPVGQFGGTAVTGEILVVGSRWVMPLSSWWMYASGWPASKTGIATSDDGGVTWTERFSEGWYGQNSAYWFSRNFGKFGDNWYVVGAGNVNPTLEWRSSDLATWTSRNADAAAPFPISQPGIIYRVPQQANSHLEAATAAPETSPSWSQVANLPVVTGSANLHLANIGSAPRPVYAATYAGKIQGLSRSQVQAPPCRQYPRDDGLGTSSAPRTWPPPSSEQGGFRQIGYY